jgi:POT family proton-dependent oligopeptide transporter
MSNSTDSFFESKVLGHPAGLFVLFFTEMWERFSYYGMRALLVLFFTASIADSGWGWPREWALAIFGTYTSLVYLSTMIGGYMADNKIGYRWAVVIGALLMTLGHGCMALETQFFIYLGLTLLVFGSGFFKPNMTSIISEMYKDRPEKKDGAYTIFYMGVNAGAFLGILLCGYLGEKVGWSWGFGVAGIFMLFGLLQFWLAQGIFGDVGKVPDPNSIAKQETANLSVVTQVKPYEIWQKAVGALALVGAVVWLFLGMNIALTLAVILALVFFFSRFSMFTAEEDEEVRNPFTMPQKVIAGIAAALGLIWIINDPASKISEGQFNLLDFSINGVDGTGITILVALTMFIFLLIYRLAMYDRITRDRMIAVSFFAFVTIFFWAIFEQAPGSLTIFANDYTERMLDGTAASVYKVVNSLMTLIPLGIISWVLYKLFRQTFAKYSLSNIFLALSFVIVWGIAIWMLREEYFKDATEVPASWFGVLNSLFIITFAPLFSKWWESKYNPNANTKYAIGMFLLGLGMACVAIGARDIEPGAKTAAVSMIWLVLVYLFHTLGELCTSPVSLSYVSKLVPGRMIAFMFGIWYLAVAIGMKLAGVFGESSEAIAAEHGLSYFFWILTAISVGVGVLSMVLYPVIRKLMHGVR